MIELEPQDSWDIKKILMLLGAFGVIAVSLKIFILDKNNSLLQKKNQSVEVQGVSTKINSNPSSLDLQKNVESKLNELKKEVNNINVVDVATSSPAVQKVINDLKNLQNVPQSQAKDACLKICNSL